MYKIMLNKATPEKIYILSWASISQEIFNKNKATAYYYHVKRCIIYLGNNIEILILLHFFSVDFLKITKCITSNRYITIEREIPIANK